MNADELEQSRAAELLDEFIRAHLAGEAPDPVAYASRGGADSTRLRELIALFLAESEPVEPTPDAAARLSARYTTDSAAVPHVDPAPEAPGFLVRAMARLLSGWRAATVERRSKLLDQIAAQTYTFTLTAETMRGVEEEFVRGTFIIPLHHPSGASAEVGQDDQLRLTVFGMPSESVGSSPLVAFPLAPSEGLDLVWSGHDRGLPDGLVEADMIGEKRVLYVQIGKLGERRHLDRLLEEVRVVGVPSTGSRDD